MIVRRAIACDACNCVVITRTSIGLRDSQVHAYRCPECGTGITYDLLLNQNDGTGEFCEKPENGTWKEEIGYSDHYRAFNPELLMRQEIHQKDFVSPFIDIFPLFKDYSQFTAEEQIRIQWRKSRWPIVQRLPTHFENRNWNLLDSDCEALGIPIHDNSVQDRLSRLRHSLVFPFSLMLFNATNRIETVAARIEAANASNANLCKTLATEYKDTGRLLELWHQLNTFHASFASASPSLSPLLQPERYWNDTPDDVNNYIVTDKRFDSLKALYIEAFETFARISAIAIGFEAIIDHDSLQIPTNAGSIDLWAFEGLPNANKPHHLDKYVIGPLFSPLLDTSLRNGIGHNAARYDAASDDIVLVKANGSSLTENRLGYTAFCNAVLKMTTALFYSEDYYFRLLLLADGRLQ